MLEGCPTKERSAGAASFKIVMVGFCRLSLIVMKQLLAERTKQEELEVGMEKMKISTEKMEWKNRLLLDSDDDSDPERDPENPLAVLAQGLVPPTSSRAQSKDRREDRMSNFVGSRPEVEKFATAQASRVDLVLSLIHI